MMKEKEFIYGLHAVDVLLEKNPESIIKLSVCKDRLDQKLKNIVNAASLLHIPIEWVKRSDLDQWAQYGNHQGVVAFCKSIQKYTEQDLEPLLEKLVQPVFLLILDGVQDPHNLGACLRSADAAGVHAVIAPKDKSVGLTAAVSKVASGAAAAVPFIPVTNLVRTMQFLKEKNIWMVGTAEDAELPYFSNDMTGSVAVVMGSEGKGLRRLTREYCDFLVSIPMQGSVPSLNVSVAAGIMLFEVVRQRFRSGKF